MRALPLVAVAVAVVLGAAPFAQTRPGVDLGSSQVVAIANGDLGSGRIVAQFLVTPSQLDGLLSQRDAPGAVRRSGENSVVAKKGFSLIGTPSGDGQADCTLRTTTCFVVPDDSDAWIVIVNRGSPADR